MSNTKAQVKDGRLAIFAQDAIHPAATTLPLEQAQSGAFEIVSEGALAKLSFRPAGRKTADVLATYNSTAKAERALKQVYAALGGGSSRFGKILKILGWIAGGIVALFILLLILSNGAQQSTAPDGNAAPVSADQPLPVGVPFPVDDFVAQTQEEGE